MNAQQYLRDLVGIDSTRGNESAVADYLEPLLVQLGFSIETCPANAARRNILASRGVNPTLCCYGHMDTVPVYSGWHTDPFTLTARGDKLHGLGACDMKGGISALLAAVEQLPANLPLKLLFCYDEEYDSDGAWLVAQERADWFRGVTHLLSVEAGTVATATGPTITLGRRGRARYEATIAGFSAHGGTNERGVSAISLASQLTARLESSPMPTHPQLGTGSQFVARIISENSGLSVPDRCDLEVERHFVAPETAASVLARYQATCNQLLKETPLTPEQRAQVSISIRLKARTNPYMESYVTSPRDPFVQLAQRLMQKQLESVVVAYGRSVADENIMANTLGLPTIVIGPRGGNEHSPNEWTSASNLTRYTNLYRCLLTEWAQATTRASL